jgi:hypothetical protein
MPIKETLMIKIDKALGFSSFAELDHPEEVRFIHSDPIEACLPHFTYAAIDVSKYDSWWAENHRHSYIPEDLDEILTYSDLTDPSLQHRKSISKTRKLIDAYNSNMKIDLVCPVLTEHFPSLQQGRHRFWFARHMKLPFLIVAVHGRALRTLVESGLLYSSSLRSKFVFNRNFEVIKDLTKVD